MSISTPELKHTRKGSVVLPLNEMAGANKHAAAISPKREAHEELRKSVASLLRAKDSMCTRESTYAMADRANVCDMLLAFEKLDYEIGASETRHISNYRKALSAHSNKDAKEALRDLEGMKEAITLQTLKSAKNTLLKLTGHLQSLAEKPGDAKTNLHAASEHSANAARHVAAMFIVNKTARTI